MITSNQNAKIKWVRLLQASNRMRHEEGVFLVEGVRLAEEALAAGWEARLVLYTDDLGPRGKAVVDGFVQQGAPVEEASSSVLRAASDTQNPQGIIAVIATRSLPLPDLLDFVFIPDGVRDPGNLGTMLRTASAAGAGAAFLPPRTADAFAPKVLRAGMGAHFRLPMLNLTWEEIAGRTRQANLQVYLAAAGSGIAYTQTDFRTPFALIIGGEAGGAGGEAEGIATQSVHIPMPGGAESLNAAAAAAILLFEAVRQRLENRPATTP